MRTTTQKAILQTLGMLLALGVGILLGAQFCAPPPEEPELCPEPQVRIERVPYCPPDAPPPEEPEATEPPPPRPAPPVPRPAEETRTLPESPPALGSEERRFLLGWARGQASSLQSCPRDLGRTYRLAITLDLAAEGGIRSVSINSDDDELPAALSQCLRERIMTWPLPDEFEPRKGRLLFRLTL